MNCERAEGYLSAFLDDALDPRLSQQVRAHVAECAHCRAILDDYGSFDHLLATTPRIEPPESLRARIFDSDEYKRISAEREAVESGAGDLPDMVADMLDPGALNLPMHLSPEQLAPDQLALEFDLGALTDVDGTDEVLPRVMDFPSAEGGLGSFDALADLDDVGATDLTDMSDATDGDKVPIAGRFAFAHAGSPLWSRVLLPAAAILALTLGTAVMMKQGFAVFSSNTASGTTSTLGNPGNSGIPLAAGPRVVYLHDGILWSAPESGPGLKQPLTASGTSGVTVGTWSVSPNGQLVAYVDLRSGKLHVVRSDGLSDHAVAANVTSGLAWSPDSARVAYLTGGQGKHLLHAVNSDGSNDLTLSTSHGDASSAVWSSDSQWAAFTLTHDGTTSIWSFSLSAANAYQVAALADGADAQANVAQLAWLPDMQHPALTWETSDTNGGIEGIYSQSVLGANQNGAGAQLSPAGAHYSSAAYTPARSGGSWLVAEGNALTLISANGAHIVVGTLDLPASRIIWSATGVAAVTHGNTLSLWTADSGLVTVDTGLSVVAPVWSSDGASLLYAKTKSVQIAHVTNGKVDTTSVMQAADVNAIGIAPDNQSVALATSGWVVLSSPDGAHVKIVDHHAPQDGYLAWSVAG